MAARADNGLTRADKILKSRKWIAHGWNYQRDFITSNFLSLRPREIQPSRLDRDGRHSRAHRCRRRVVKVAFMILKPRDQSVSVFASGRACVHREFRNSEAAFASRSSATRGPSMNIHNRLTTIMPLRRRASRRSSAERRIIESSSRKNKRYRDSICHLLFTTRTRSLGARISIACLSIFLAYAAYKIARKVF